MYAFAHYLDVSPDSSSFAQPAQPGIRWVSLSRVHRRFLWETTHNFYVLGYICTSSQTRIQYPNNKQQVIQREVGRAH